MSRVSKSCRLAHVCSVAGLSYAWSSVSAELKAARQQSETNGVRAKGLEENVSELGQVVYDDAAVVVLGVIFVAFVV